jgi:hypothetical protein
MWMLLIVGGAAHPFAYTTGWIGVASALAALFVKAPRCAAVLQLVGPLGLLVSAVSMNGLPYCVYFYLPATLSLLLSGIRAWKTYRYLR